MLGSSWVAVQLAASGERLGFMELVKKMVRDAYRTGLGYRLVKTGVR
jgi:hypothetical protein